MVLSKLAVYTCAFRAENMQSWRVSKRFVCYGSWCEVHKVGLRAAEQQASDAYLDTKLHGAHPHTQPLGPPPQAYDARRDSPALSRLADACDAVAALGPSLHPDQLTLPLPHVAWRLEAAAAGLWPAGAEGGAAAEGERASDLIVTALMVGQPRKRWHSGGSGGCTSW